MLNGGATSMVVGCDCKNNTGTPNTQYDLDADVVVLRASDGSSVVRFNPGAALTNNISTAGPAANGRDQSGAFTDPSFIHFYWIWNGSTLATVSSAAAPPTGPTLPSGYTHWAYAGAVYFVSSALKKVRIKGSTAFYEGAQNVLNNGNATTETAVSCAAAVPANALSFQIRGDSQHATDTDVLIIRVVSGTDYAAWDNTVAANEMLTISLQLPNISQQFYYLKSAASGTNTDFDVLSYVLPNGGE